MNRLPRSTWRVATVVAALAALARPAVAVSQLERPHRRRAACGGRARARWRPTRSPTSTSSSASGRRWCTSPRWPRSARCSRSTCSRCRAAPARGFIWDDAGHVVTNFHVIQGGNGARVTLADQSSYPAKLVGAFPDRDLAVLRIDAPKDKLPPIPVGTSRDLVVGQRVYAIGNPFGLDQTLTTGIVSALNREIESFNERADPRRDPDRRRHQPRQLGRPAARLGRPPDRRQRADRQPERRQRRHRLRDPGRRGQPRGAAADPRRQASCARRWASRHCRRT